MKNKRESGENPGQSRCCELRIQVPDNTPATVLPSQDGKASGRKQVRRPASRCKRLHSRGFRVGHLHFIFTVLFKAPEMKTDAPGVHHVAITPGAGLDLKDPPRRILSGAFFRKKPQADDLWRIGINY